MKKIGVLTVVTAVLLMGCATTKVSNRCLTYTIHGDDVSWKPIKFYQNTTNQLFIEIPRTTNYIPNLEVVDTEFDQPYKINYSFDKTTYRFRVEDNHDEYLLYRASPDGVERDNVYISCNHKN